MGNAGYLESTTAKRQDCILSYRWFFEPLLKDAKKGNLPEFGKLITNTGNWADRIIETSRRHRSRGVTAEMFVGCFKTLVYAVLDMVHAGDESKRQKNEAVEYIRLWADALELIIIRELTTLSEREAANSLNSANRAARPCFENNPENRSVLTLLGQENRPIEKLCAYYTKNNPLEISIGENLYFHCVFIPMNEVSLASEEYLVVLKDVSAHVKQSEILESIVASRTSELIKKKNSYRR